MGGFGVFGLWVTLALTLVVAIAVALGFLWLSKRTLGENVGPTHNPSLSPFLTVVGLVFGALLGFTVVVAWEQFSSAEANVAHEASTLTTMYRQTVAMPDPQRTQLRQQLRKYAEAVSGPEWSAQETGGGTSDTARAAITEMYRLFGNPCQHVESSRWRVSQSADRIGDRQKSAGPGPRTSNSDAVVGRPHLRWRTGDCDRGFRPSQQPTCSRGPRERGRPAAGLAPVRRLLARPSIWNGNRRHAGTVPSRR